MAEFQPFLYARTLDDDLLQADFGSGPDDKTYMLGNAAFYRRISLHLPLWRYIPYDAIVSAEAKVHEFTVGG